MKRYGFLLLIFSCIHVQLYSQGNANQQLAIKYFQNGEYDKAAEMFYPLWKAQPANDFFYNYLLTSYIQSNQIEKAFEIVKYLIKRYKKNASYRVDMGYLFKISGEENKAEKIFSREIKNLKPIEYEILQLSNDFYRRKEYQYAIKTLLKGRELLKNDNKFSLTLARLYQETGQNEEMIKEYLKQIKLNPGLLPSVQNLLQDYVRDEEAYRIVKAHVIDAIHQENYYPAYVDLLSWLLIQHGDFEEAFRHQKALDKRIKDNSRGLIQLAETCVKNQAYDIAEQIYQYVMDKGMNNPYYYTAKFSLIEIKYKILKSQSHASREELEQIEKDFTDFLRNNFYRYISLSEKVVLYLAELKALYLDKLQEAIDLLNNYLTVSRISKETRARMKMNLADYNILKGKVWEASLLYQQVIKEFKDHPLGHEAKFKNAKLYFYLGQFDWAADQLNILKASTSELIANDALQLALLIQDNMEMDTTLKPLKLYARADFFYAKRKYDSALVTLDTLIHLFPSKPIYDNAIFLKGQIFESQKEYDTALYYYHSLLSHHNDNLLIDDALYRIALIYEQNLQDIKSAAQYYEKILLEYPGSVFAPIARKHFRQIQEQPSESPETSEPKRLHLLYNMTM